MVVCGQQKNARFRVRLCMIHSICGSRVQSTNVLQI